MFTANQPFDARSIASVPTSAGCYIVYDRASPIYVGRSSFDIRRRLQAHFRGNRSLAMTRAGSGSGLSFRYCLVPMSVEKAAESVLIEELGVTQFASLRGVTAADDWESLA